MEEAKPLAIIIPVYNEAENFPLLWADLVAKIRSAFVAYVIFDFDQDDTIPAVQSIIAQGERRFQLIKNSVRSGVVGAILTGFRQVSDGPVLIVMADLSDDLGQVDTMLGLYHQGYHVVAGSRYMKGGSIEGGPWFKQFLSRMAGLTLCWFRGLPTHDATNAFKIYDGAMVNSFAIESRKGFELNLEITVKAFLEGYRITEVPSRWRDRSHGQSRFRLWAWLPHYLNWYFYAFQFRRRPQDRVARP